MGNEPTERGEKLGFLDSLGAIFRGERGAREPEANAPETAEGFARLEADFETSILGLKQRIEEQRRPGRAGMSAREQSRLSAEHRAADRLRRMEESHRAIREDIESMHDRLGTGMSGDELETIRVFLGGLEDDAAAGRASYELIPRARHAIAARLCVEAGEAAVERLVELLTTEGLDWPDPTHYRPGATPEEIERSRRRRLSDVRASFLAKDLASTAERLFGIVQPWGSDYPDRGSPLWEETVLEGVAAGLRGQLLQDFVGALRDERERLLSRTEESIGKEINALHEALESGACTADQAKRVMASSLRVLDEVVPEIAWEIVCARLPEARDEP